MFDLKSNDNNLYHKKVTDNLGLVHNIIKRYLNRGVDYDDLFQIGCIGLLNAAKRYNSSLGYEFSTYACSLIIGEIKRFFRDDGIIKVSRKLKEISIKIKNFINSYELEFGKTPSISVIVDTLGYSPEEISTALDAVKTPSSICEKNENGIEFSDRYAGKINELENSIEKILISDIINSFPDRDKKIILYRYYKDKTQKETAKLLNLSQVQVSRIEKKLLEIIRNKFN